jgi:hypothetical protein
MTTHTDLRSIYSRIDLKKCSVDELQKMFSIYIRHGMEDIADEICERLFFMDDTKAIIKPVTDQPPTIADEVPGWLQKFPFNLLWKQRPNK